MFYLLTFTNSKISEFSDDVAVFVHFNGCKNSSGSNNNNLFNNKNYNIIIILIILLNNNNKIINCW